MKLVLSLVIVLILLLGGVVYIYTNRNNTDTELVHPLIVLEDDNNETKLTPLEEEIKFHKEKFESSWDDIESSLNNAIEIYSQILKLQDKDDKSILDRILDKEASLKDELYAIFDELIVDELRDSRIEDYKSNIIDIQEYIKDLKLSLQENIELIKDAPKESWFNSTKDDYKVKIKDLKNEIIDYQKERKKNIYSIKSYIRAMGINLSDNKLELLLKRVDFLDMLDMVLVINMADMTMEKLNKNRLNYKNTMQYYSINEILFELVIYKANQYIKYIENRYINSLIELDKKNEKLYQSNKIKFLQEKNRTKREIYRDSIMALKLFKKASIIYKNDLARQKIRLLKIVFIASSNLEVSKTQYRTSKHSLERLKPIRNMRGEFQKMIKLFSDIKASFKSSKLKNKYIEITDKI